MVSVKFGELTTEQGQAQSRKTSLNPYHVAERFVGFLVTDIMKSGYKDQRQWEVLVHAATAATAATAAALQVFLLPMLCGTMGDLWDTSLQAFLS